jgi:hypothetical protein
VSRCTQLDGGNEGKSVRGRRGSRGAGGDECDKEVAHCGEAHGWIGSLLREGSAVTKPRRSRAAANPDLRWPCRVALGHDRGLLKVVTQTVNPSRQPGAVKCV